MKRPEQPWQKLVEAGRRTPSDADPQMPPPPGFANRILNLRESIVSLARVLFWRRWSFSVAILCFVLFLVILATHRCSQPAKPLIDAPNPPPIQSQPR